MDKITKRQLQLLHAIEELTAKNGVPPTIVELKKELGVNSDQSVYQLLKKLEEADLIEREPGKRRSIRLINKQPNTKALGSNKTYPLSGNQRGPNFLMDAVQKKIFDKLHEINPRVAIAYKGALFTLSQKEYHPDWMAQVANSFRGIFNILVRDTNTETPKAKETPKVEKENVGVQKISKVFDPSPYGAIAKVEKAAWEHWNKLNAYFTSVSHYGEGYETEEKEFLNKVNEFNELLGKYVLPDQLDVYEHLDTIIKNGPKKAVPEEVRKYLRNMAAYSYFFSHIDFKWFDFLRANSLLQPSFQVGTYLVQSATTIPDKIADLVKQYSNEYKLEENDKSIRRFFIAAAIGMPIANVNKIISTMIKQKWVEETPRGHDFLFYEIKKLLEKLITNGEYRSAKNLIQKALDFRPSDKKQSVREIEGYVDSYFYAEILKSILQVPASNRLEFAKLLADCLVKAISVSNKDMDRYFYIWRRYIGENDRHRDDTADVLIDAVRDIAISYLDDLKNRGENLVDALDNIFPELNSNIFKRLRLYIYNRYPKEFLEKIQWAIVEYFDDHALEKEYDEVLTQEFCNIDKTFQSKYLQLVNKGPAEKKLNEDQEYKRYWKIRKLFLIKNCLNKEWQKIYKDLLGNEEESKFKPRYSGEMTSWVGPTAPIKSTDLGVMSVDELVSYLINWQPSEGHFGEPSRMGLARELAEAIKNNPNKYSKDALKFNNDALHPVYIYQYFMGIRESLKITQPIEWSPILDLMTEVVEKGKNNKLVNFDPKEDEWKTDWSTVFQYMADLIENGLTSTKSEPPFALCQKIWNIIEYICEDKEPDLEHEKKYGGDNMDYYTLSINTARGEAFHALFQYIFWCDRNDRQTEGKRIPEEVKKVLEDHLDEKKEPGHTIPAVYGRFFPWIYIYDKDWTKKIINKLFPLDNIERRYAVWQTYLTNAVYPEIFEDLRPQYERGVQELKKPTLKKKSHLMDTQESLINHLMIAYAYNVIKKDDPLLKLFYKEANREQKGNAVNFLGRIYIASEKTAVKDHKPDKQKLKEFWEFRLKESETMEELIEFGWWTEDGYFDNGWMLEKLLETLNKTNGLIKPGYQVIEILKKLAISHPVLVSKCLLKIVKAKYQDQFLHMTKEMNIKDIVEQLYNSENEEVRKIISQVSDQMLRLGNDEFRAYMKPFDQPPKTDGEVGL